MKTNYRITGEEIIIDSLRRASIGVMPRQNAVPFASSGDRTLPRVQIFRHGAEKMEADSSERTIRIEMMRSTELWEDISYLLFELCGLGAIAMAFSS